MWRTDNIIGWLALLCGLLIQSCTAYRPKLISQQPVFQVEEVTFKQCHASSIHAFDGGHLLTVWFGGTHEGHTDVGIWASRYENEKWEAPILIADGNIDGISHPCWNPVLYQFPDQDTLYLYYKVGPNPREWWGVYRYSTDQGKSWSDTRNLPKDILGPIKNKPYTLSDGTILSPSSTESLDEIWKAHIEVSKDQGQTWEIRTIHHDDSIQAIQPSIVEHPDGRIQVLCRSKENYVMSTFSSDQGRTWMPWRKTNLQNPNSATDAIRLQNGKFLIVYNPDIAGKDWWEGRTKLRVALSDDGLVWKDALTLEDGKENDEYSYPTVIQAEDGSIHITYTWNRKTIKHVVLK